MILAHRYGTRATDGVSYTEKEYDYAVASGVPTLGFILNSNSWDPAFVDSGQDKVELDKFKDKVRAKNVSYWSSMADLEARVLVSLQKQIARTPRPGWIRGDEATSPETTNELARLSKENAELRARTANGRAVLTVEFGGLALRRAPASSNPGVKMVHVAGTILLDFRPGDAITIQQGQSFLSFRSKSGWGAGVPPQFIRARGKEDGFINIGNEFITVSGPGRILIEHAFDFSSLPDDDEIEATLKIAPIGGHPLAICTLILKRTGDRNCWSGDRITSFP